jgi:hypothetical protein
MKGRPDKLFYTSAQPYGHDGLLMIVISGRECRFGIDARWQGIVGHFPMKLR